MSSLVNKSNSEHNKYPNLGNFCLWNPKSWDLESLIKLEESGIAVTIGFWTTRFWHRIRNQRRGIHNSILSWIPFHWANSNESHTCKFSPVLYSASRDYIFAVWTSYFSHTDSNRENIVSVLWVPVLLFAILKSKDELEEMSSSWGRTCFSHLWLGFDLVDVFFLFCPSIILYRFFFYFFVYLCRIFVILSCHLLEKSCLNSSY